MSDPVEPEPTDTWKPKDVRRDFYFVKRVSDRYVWTIRVGTGEDMRFSRSEFRRRMEFWTPGTLSHKL